MKKLICAMLAFAVVMSLNITSFGAVKRISSVSYSEDAVHVIENSGGRFIVDDEEDDDFYLYEPESALLIEGSSITVNYTDGSSKEYVARKLEVKEPDGWTEIVFDFFDEEGDSPEWYVVEEVSQYEEHWTVGGEYVVYVQVGAKNCPVNVIVDETPVESAEYVTENPAVFRENTNGYTDFMLGENWEMYTAFTYDFLYAVSEGDYISVNFKDGSTVAYYAVFENFEYIDEETGETVSFPYVFFADADGNELAIDNIFPDEEPWGVGNHAFSVLFLGASVDIPVTIVKGNHWYCEFGIWYYIENGIAATGWVKDKGKWYYFDEFGEMQTGWQRIGGKWYYLDKNGSMKTGWLKSGGKWYYLTSSGAMATGWQKVSNKWYYFDGKGVMKTGWLKLSGKWYYLGTDGSMTTGSRRIGTKTYKFNSSGVCLNP